MNNSLGFLLAYKSAEGLPKNKRLLYGILGAQAPAGDLSQTIVPVLLAKREVKNLPQSTPPPSEPNQNSPELITLEQLEEFVERFKQQEQDKEEQEKEIERIKAMYKCLEDCLAKISQQQSEYQSEVVN